MKIAPKILITFLTAMLVSMGAFVFLGIKASDAYASKAKISYAKKKAVKKNQIKKKISIKRTSNKDVLGKSLPASFPVKTAFVGTTNLAACDQSTFEGQFLCLINNYRVSQGKNRLSYIQDLNKVAYDYAVTMQTTGYFAHRAQDGSNFVIRCQRAGTYCYGENLAKGFVSASNLFEMWKASPSHNTIMLGPYKQIGLGIYKQYATSLFR